MSYQIPAKQIVEFGRLLYENRLIAGFDGNLSIKTKKNNILITPTRTAKGFLREENLITVDMEGNIITGTGKASSELLMHLYIYRNRPEIKACCHAHPPFATAFSSVEKSMPFDILPEIIVTVGKIAYTRYFPPGTDAVESVLEEHVVDNNAFLLENHGVLTIGRSLEEAYFRMETVEHYAKIIYIAQNIGDLNRLDPDEIDRLGKTTNSTVMDK